VGLARATMAGVRLLSLAVAAGAILSLALIASTIAAGPPLHLERFREPTWVLYGALALFAVARPRPRAFASEALERAGRALGSPRFFPTLMVVLLLTYSLVSVTTHLAFKTFSHDFGIFDEALEWSLRGSLLHSPILGRGFLTEHFSPILLLLVPLHALWRSPWLLVAAHGILLWSAVFPLRALLTSEGVSPRTTNLACLVYLTNPITASALSYGFHVEAFLPVTLFWLFLAHRRGLAWAYWALLPCALAIKEDVGIYLVGLAIWQVFAERRVARGVATGAVALLWVGLVLFVLTPRLLGATEGYRFFGRWSVWGFDPWSAFLGMVSRPDRLGLALLAPTYLLFFWRLVATPALSRWGWLLILLPWTISATSDSHQQRTLGLYYGLPLLAFSALASAAGLAGEWGRRLLASRWAPLLACLAVVLNVAHFTIPRVPAERPAFLDALARIPPGATVQAMSCFVPVVGYDRDRAPLMPGDSLRAEFVLLRTDETTWPFSAPRAQSLADDAVDSGRYNALYRQGTFLVLRRRDAAGHSG
jgi:uncharacterized membrane protein